ncbi:arsenate reductase [Diaphorobacter aerolatus]|uniref:Arsenate reductase n=1 Tax=Diaphorobacter aerolatus TaxID=1288495 RepID=A0A7H0GLX5_9BURK|nr:arsenate reductase [Diaphorobacter aerolatus]QNP49291.1 arsenate reductase [Diaphorobacter aerolatus]
MSTPTIIIYGIPNCDTVKKARSWLTDQGVNYEFHDFKKQGVPADRLPLWLKAVGRDKLLNTKGTTWRKLDPAVQAQASDDAGAIEVMKEHASVIKRPVVEWQGQASGPVTVGFDVQKWNELIGN